MCRVPINECKLRHHGLLGISKSLQKIQWDSFWTFWAIFLLQKAKNIFGAILEQLSIAKCSSSFNEQALIYEKMVRGMKAQQDVLRHSTEYKGRPRHIKHRIYKQQQFHQGTHPMVGTKQLIFGVFLCLLVGVPSCVSITPPHSFSSMRGIVGDWMWPKTYRKSPFKSGDRQSRLRAIFCGYRKLLAFCDVARFTWPSMEKL